MTDAARWMLCAAMLIAGGGPAQGSNAQPPDAPAPRVPVAAPAPQTPAAATEGQKAARKPAPSAVEDNPFPEDISRKAEEEAKRRESQRQDPAAAGTDANGGESSSANGYKPPTDEPDEREQQPERRKLSIDGAPTTCTDSAGKTVVCGTGGVGRPVEPDERLAPHADKRALQDEEIADAYFKDGNFAGALKRYEDALAYAPDDEAAAFGVAESARKLGKREEAINAYTTYLKLAPQGRKAKQAQKELDQLNASAKR